MSQPRLKVLFQVFLLAGVGGEGHARVGFSAFDIGPFPTSLSGRVGAPEVAPPKSRGRFLKLTHVLLGKENSITRVLLEKDRTHLTIGVTVDNLKI